MTVVGVDGCRGGWIAMFWQPGDNDFNHAMFSDVRAIIDAFPDVETIAIDIPIGLKECESRQCDVLARKLLGPRGRSVFPAPHAEIVCETEHQAANASMRDFCVTGISAQTFGIFPRTCEANATITADDQDRIIEVHPELCFWAMNGKSPCEFSKRTAPGYGERHSLLSRDFGTELPDWTVMSQRFRPAKPDDVLDSLAAVWTAHRHATGVAERVPKLPEIGVNGLRMEIVY